MLLKKFLRLPKIRVSSFPYVSVTIPALNSEKTIGSLLVRIFDSSFRDFEVIVVDDASTDRTGQVIYEFCEGMTKILKGRARFSYKQSTVRVGKGDERLVRQWKLGDIVFTYHRLSVRGGAARARNEGVRLSRGEVVLLFDSDVLPMIDMVEHVAKWFSRCVNGNHTRCVAVTGFPGTQSENMGFGARYKYWRDYTYWYIENDDNSFYHFRPAVGAIRRKIFWEAGGYDERYPGATMEDMEFSYRLSKYGKIVFDKNMIVAHPFGDLLDLVRTYFLRSFYYMELFLSRKQFTGVAMTGHEAETIITAALLAGVLFLGFVFWFLDKAVFVGLLGLSLLLLSWFVYLQKKFLILVLEKEGTWFVVKSIFASFILYIVICFGGARFLMRKLLKLT